MGLYRKLGALLAIPALAGCATVGTRLGSAATDQGGEGIEYFLPTGQFRLTAAEDDGRIDITISGPLMTADNLRRVRTKLLAGTISDNDFSVEVGPNGLLTSFSGNSEGKLETIVENVIKSAIAIQGGGSELEPFFSDTFEFDQAEAASRRVNAAIQARIAAICAEAANQTRCETLRARAPNRNFVTVSVNGGDRAAAPAYAAVEDISPGTRTGPNCPADALCYHPLAPVRLTLALTDGTSSTETFLVPDKSRLSYVRAPAGAFAKQEYSFTFTNGILSKYDRTSRSELVGIASLPLTIVKAIISAPAEVLASRGEALKAQDSYLAAVQANAAAKKETAAKCSDRPDLCAGYVYRIITVSTGTPAATETDDPTG